MNHRIVFTQVITLIKLSLLTMLIASCSIQNRSMKSTSELLLLNVKDFELSDQVTAKATVIRFFGIDWKRLFSWETGVIGDGLQQNPINAQGNYLSFLPLTESGAAQSGITTILPVIGIVLRGNTSAYALNTLMKENPGYDMIIYPQYYRKKKTVPFFYSKTEVEVTARLGKLKSE